MKLRDIMTTEVQTCSPQDSLVQVAKIMWKEDVGIIPVVEGNKLVGVVTDRDIVLRCVAEGDDIRATTAQKCITTDMITATPDMDAHEAARLMGEHQIRRLPIVENGRLSGIVAIGDMAVVSIHEDEAGRALSGISEPDVPHH
ncbi:CBS domain-containing protein [Aneurinibacillus sp. Ricciae_BoGa-3]|uniref:CBS domain-containing protein n=1 Tax=Aneurinibacillus sp. Ricciae_BoGa-3 TaxID=3022697 RepID=UPI0023405A89|nr:CBS domain-containing protein [Aneurinibacillus sp. Ricciae_BoGa-3]WCK54863.1 CBS domain-containing protein [Aneurinibacillus sp. Ricciae_BoGa-3]